MLNLIQADLYKLIKSTSMKILFGIATACSVIMAVFAYLIPQGKIEASISGIGFMFSDVNVISILGGIIAGIMICRDFDNKTIHDSIAHGNGRGIVIMSKASVLAIALAVILIPYAIVTFITLGTGSEYDMGSVAVGFLHLLTAESASALSGAEFVKIAALMLTLVIVYAAQLSICVPLAFMLKRPIFVMAIYYVLTAQLIRFSQESPAFDRVFSLTPYGGKHAFVTLDTSAGDLIQTLVISLAFMAVMVAVTYGAFRKSEIK
jgi:ABC-2 type transport system permease protein